MTPEERLERAREATKCFDLSNDKLRHVMKILNEEFDRGLKDETKATLKMLITYVRDIPKGNEVGTYMALDLGGTNFRVLTVTLDGHSAVIDTETCEIPASLMVGPGRDLFDRIAECVYMFIRDRKISVPYLPIGFTFSFPCYQHGLDSAKLIRWTKGFKCPDVEGQDIVILLREALTRRKGSCKTKVDVVAVINDTTGTLMSCAHRNTHCRVGLIVGTGTNLCYMEKLDRVVKWRDDRDDPKQVAINTEWGAFGDHGRLNDILTPFDRKVDESSLNPGAQIFEKMVSGMYLGEIARYILIHLHSQGILFPGCPLPEIQLPKSFSAKHLSRVASRRQESTTKVFTKMKADKHDTTDVEIVKHVCEMVVSRAANLVSAGLAVVLNRLERGHTTIGYDGSVLRYHPTFRSKVEEKIRQLCSHKFDLMLSEDGSGRGAALVAAIACRNFNENRV